MDYIYFEEAGSLYTIPQIVAAYAEAVQHVPTRSLLGKSAFGNRLRVKNHAIIRALQAEGFGEVLPFDSNGGGDRKLFLQRDQLEYAIRLLRRLDLPEGLEADLNAARAASERRREASFEQFRPFTAADQRQVDDAIAAGRITVCKPMYAYGAVPDAGAWNGKASPLSSRIGVMPAAGAL